MFVGKIDHENPLNRPKGRELSHLGAQDFHGMLEEAISKQGGSDSSAGANSPASLAQHAKPLSPLGDGYQAMPLRPMTPWDRIPGIKGPPMPLKRLSTERHPAKPMSPMEPGDSVPGVRKSAKSQEDKVNAMARKWVAQTFYGTLFKQMRDSPFKSHIFDGGRGGQAFAPMLDQHLVDHMGKSSSKRLTGAIARKMMGKQGGGAAAMSHRSLRGSITAPSQSNKDPHPHPLPSTGEGVGASNSSEGSNPFEKVHIHVAPGV